VPVLRRAVGRRRVRLRMVGAPRLTRFVAGIYAAETVSDFLQLAYSAAEERI
jgi:hypothetical protein